jgi:hypothetical protein
VPTSNDAATAILPSASGANVASMFPLEPSWFGLVMGTMAGNVPKLLSSNVCNHSCGVDDIPESGLKLLPITSAIVCLLLSFLASTRRPLAGMTMGMPAMPPSDPE